MKKKILILTILALCAVAGATALGDLAAGMNAGEWRTFATTNVGPTIAGFSGGATGCIFPYACGGVWDPASLSFYFVGSDHQHSTGYPKFIKYSAASNAWSVMSQPSWFPSLTANAMHGYDGNAIDAQHGVLYFARYCCNSTFYKYTISTSTWTQLPDCGSLQYSYQNCGGLEYFPELGGLVFCSGMPTAGSGAVYFFNTTTNAWSKIASGLAIGDYHNFAEYNPVHHVVVLGGGNSNSAIYKLDAQKNITRLTDAPAAVSSLRVNYNIFTADPVTGDYLVYGGEGGSGASYKYNVVTDTWTNLNHVAPFMETAPNANGGAVFLSVGSQISSYGVNMFVKYTGGGGAVYVYKHSSGSAVEGSAINVEAKPGLKLSPNPFRGGAMIRMDGALPGSHAVLRVLSPDGRIVRTENVTATALSHGVNFAGSGLSCGIYIFSLDFGRETYQTGALLMR